MEITDATNNQNKKLVSIDVAIKYIFFVWQFATLAIFI